MPTIGPFHSFWWNLSDTTVAPVRIGRGGYPAWQASVVVGSGFGPIGAWCSETWTAIKYWWALKQRVQALPQAQRAVLFYTLDAFTDPKYAAARTAVTETARTLGFNRPEAWIQYSRMLKSDMGRQENHYRHLRAVVRTRELIKPSTITNPMVNFYTELAYQEYAVKPWR